jgi:hypothetical protein
MYINDTPQHLVFTSLSADTCTYGTDHKVGYVLRKLQRGLSTIKTWSERWNMLDPGLLATVSVTSAYVLADSPDQVCEPESELLYERGLVRRLPLLLNLAGAVIPGSECRGAHDVLLSENRDSPNLEGQIPIFTSLRNRVAQLYLQKAVA